jgi:O-antigen/teichoic acid export membrane protein
VRDHEFVTLKRMLSESAVSALGMVAGILMSYVLLGLLTRALSAESFGAYSVLVSMLELALVVVLLGLPQAVDRFTALYNARGEMGKTRTLVVGTLTAMLGIGIVGYAAVALTATPIARTFLGSAGRATAVIVFAASFPLALLIRSTLAVFVGFKEARYYVLVDRVFVPALRLLLGAAAFALGYGLLGWLGAYSVAMLIGLAAALVLLRRRVWNRLARVPRQPIPVGRILDFAWPLMIVNATTFVAKDVPVLWLGRGGAVASAGVLRLYLQIAGLFALVLSAISRIHLPVLTELLSREEHEVARRTHGRVSKWGFVVGIYGAGALVVLGSPFIAILFTSFYAESYAALLVLCLGALIRLSCGPGHAALRAMGATRMNLLSALLGAVTLGLVGALAIPKLELLGAAFAISLAWAVQDGVAAWQAFRRGRFAPFGSAHVRSLIVAGAATVLMLALRHAVGLEGPVWIAIFGVSFTLLFWIGVLLWGVVDPVDRRLLATVFLRRSGRSGD